MLAKKYNDPRWNNIRPPLERLSDSKANELEIKLKEYSFEF